MKITRININSFGKLCDKTVEFGDGFNVIYGPNESGKSTIMAYIRAMLYGFESRAKRSLTENEFKRYTPWSGERMSGTMEIEIDGKEYIIERSFYASKRSDKTRIFEKNSAEVIKTDSGESVGMRLLGINEETFERTFYIRQAAKPLGDYDNKELSARLSNIMSGADESVSAEDALERIKSAKNRIKGTSRDALFKRLDKRNEELAEQYNEILNEQQTKRELDKRENVARSESEALKKELAECDKELSRLRAAKSALYASRVVETKRRLDSCRQTEDKICALMTNGREVIDKEMCRELNDSLAKANARLGASEMWDKRLEAYREELNRINGDEDKYSGILSADTKKIDELSEKLRRYESGEEYRSIDIEIAKAEERIKLIERLLDENHAEAEKNKRLADESENQFEQLRKKKNKSAALTAAGAVVLAAAIILGLILKNAAVGICAAAVGIILIFVGAVMRRGGASSGELDKLKKSIESYRLSADNINNRIEKYNSELSQAREERDRARGQRDERGKIEEKAVRAQLLAAFRGLGCENADEYLKLLAEGAEYTARRELAKKNYTAAETEYLREKSAYEENIKAAFDDIRRFRDIGSYAEVKKYIDEFSRLCDDRTAAENAVRTAGKSFEDILGTVPYEEYERTAKNANVDDMREYSDELYEKTEARAEETRGRLNDKEKELSELKGRISEMKRLPSPEDTERSISEVRKKRADAEKYIKILDAAAEGISQAQEIAQRTFAPELNKRTSEILSNITGGKYREAAVSKDFDVHLINEHADRLWMYMSGGTVDQIYFSVRLAAAGLLDGSMPLFLDDCFTEYDSIRQKNALEFLSELSKTTQILFFTCRGDAGEYADKLISLDDLK